MCAYRVIARRWRPRRFCELVGQEAVVRTLTNAIRTDQVAHAYLFVGPRGTGKTSTARLLAMALNVEGGPSVDFDPDSPVCRAIGEGRYIDVVEIDGASNNSVEQVRALREECVYSPAEGHFKIYILDEIHMLSTAAFNALLKTVEEPPEHVKFIFATTEVHKVPTTILSRCQRFEFHPLPEEAIVKKLVEILESEGLSADPEALRVLGRIANGGMRDAQSMLDQVLAFGNGTVSIGAVREIYGLADATLLSVLGCAVEEGDYRAIVEQTDRLVADGNDFYRVLIDLQRIFRDRILSRIGTKIPTTGLSNEALAHILEVLQDGELRVQRGLSARVQFEMVLFKAVDAGRLRSMDALVEHLSGNLVSPDDGEAAPNQKKKNLSQSLP
jgi:DNA polymerase-3 subunit gamma/tau